MYMIMLTTLSCVICYSTVCCALQLSAPPLHMHMYLVGEVKEDDDHHGGNQLRFPGVVDHPNTDLSPTDDHLSVSA